MNLKTKILNYFKSDNNNGLKKRAFDAAKTTRLEGSWGSSSININRDIRLGNQKLRSRARELAENDPLARKFLRMLEKNVVGPNGFTHRNKAFDFVKDAEKNWVKKYDKLANNIIQDAFTEWSKKEYCTVIGDISFRESCNLELKTVATDGETFIHLIKGKDVNKFGFAYQLIDAEFCDETYNSVNAKNGNPIIMGIEYDKTIKGKPIAYYFQKQTARQTIYSYNKIRSYVRIPAEQIIHLYRKEFVGQLRGISWFAPTAYRMQILKGYQEAVLHNARSAARKTNVLTPRDDAAEISEANISGGSEDASGDIIRNIMPGETYIVPDGYTFDTFDPTYPAGTEGAFTAVITQAIAAGFDVDYPTLASNFRDVNYTSSRSALIDARAGYRMMQSFFVEHKLIDIRTMWLEMAMLTGAVNLPFAKFEKFNKPEFVGVKGEWTDQWKENKADDFAVRNNLETLERTLAKRGYSLEEFIEQKKYELELLKENGLANIQSGKINYMTINEKRLLDGLTALDGGDAIYLPSSEIPAIEVEAP